MDEKCPDDRGQSLTSFERGERNRAIIEARARGLSWSRIARLHGVCDRTARRIVADYRASSPALHERDPVEVVEETLAAYESAIEELAMLADETTHDSTKLGAIKARLDAFQARNELLATVGVMPRDLGALRVAIDLGQIAGRLVNLFEHAQVPEQVKAQILDAIDPPRPPELEATGHPNGRAALSRDTRTDRRKLRISLTPH